MKCDLKVLLDENCRNLKLLLLEMGWEVFTVIDVIDRKAGDNSVSDDKILSYAIENKTVIVTKDKGLKIRCLNMSIPFIDLGSPEQEARIVDRKIREMLSWKDYF